VSFERPGAGRGAGRGARARGASTTPDADADPDASADADPEAVARILCLRQLDARARTRAELAAYLNRKGVPAAAATRVLDRFTQVGLIDDSALAESFVDSRHREAGLGRRALTLKLRQRGVADDVIESAVSVVDSDAELSTARDLVQRKMRSVATLEPQVQARRLVGMLARKGYPPGLAYQVVRERLAEAELPTDVDD
jgi:regulatory protein